MNLFLRIGFLHVKNNLGSNYDIMSSGFEYCVNLLSLNANISELTFFFKTLSIITGKFL